jgi:hypothetical protein
MQKNKIEEVEGVPMRGHVTVTKYEGFKDSKSILDLHLGKKRTPSGIIVAEKENLIVYTGKMIMAHLLGNDPLAAPIRYMAFGSGLDAAVVEDVDLGIEEFREPVIYSYDNGSPNYSVTFTAAVLADEHPSVDSISEIGLCTKPVWANPTAETMDLFSHVTFPSVFFSSNAPVSMGLVVDWEIVFEAIGN